MPRRSTREKRTRDERHVRRLYYPCPCSTCEPNGIYVHYTTFRKHVSNFRSSLAKTPVDRRGTQAGRHALLEREERIQHMEDNPLLYGKPVEWVRANVFAGQDSTSVGRGSGAPPVPTHNQSGIDDHGCHIHDADTAVSVPSIRHARRRPTAAAPGRRRPQRPPPPARQKPNRPARIRQAPAGLEN